MKRAGAWKHLPSHSLSFVEWNVETVFSSHLSTSFNNLPTALTFNKVEWMLKPFARAFTIKTIEREKGFHTCRYFKINFTWTKKWMWINYKSASIGLTSALRSFFARWPMHKQSNVSLHCDVCVCVVLEVVMLLWCHVTTWRQFKWACIQCVIQYYLVLCIQRYQRLRWSSILGSSACIGDSRRHNM